MEIFASFWDNLFWFLILLTPLIFVHELGHFSVARLCGVRVDVFSIGFGPELFGWTDRKGTRWKFSAFPLGGYVKMFGEHVLEPDGDGNVRKLTAEEKAVSFQDKSLGRRTAIVAAGPGANYLFAIVVMAVMFVMLGERFTPPEIGRVVPGTAAEEAGFKAGDLILTADGDEIESYEQFDGIVKFSPGQTMLVTVLRDGVEVTLTVVPQPVEIDAIDGSTQTIGNLQITRFIPAEINDVMGDSAAEEAGLQPGDRIIELDGAPIERFDQLQDIIRGAAGRRLRMVVRRDGGDLSLEVTPKSVQEKSPDGTVTTIGRLGVTASSRTVLVKHGPATALWRGVTSSVDISVITLRAVGQMLVGARDAKELGGPIMIAKVSSKIADRGAIAFLELMVLISINLGLINLLPIPVLDGGHLFFYLAEGIRGRPVADKVQEYSYKIGLALVISLMIFVTVNDLVHRVF